MFDRNIAEQLLENNHNIHKKQDCRNGFTTYKAKGLKRVIMHIGWALTPIKVYIHDPNREIKVPFQRKGNVGRRSIGEGQKLSLMCDHLVDVRELDHIARLSVEKNTYWDNMLLSRKAQHVLQQLEMKGKLQLQGI